MKEEKKVDEKPTISVDKEAKKELVEEPKVEPETDTQKIERELREKNQEIADLKKKQQESLLDSERVAITEHFHCQICGRVFYPNGGESQIKTCLVCNPMRNSS